MPWTTIFSKFKHFPIIHSFNYKKHSILRLQSDRMLQDIKRIPFEAVFVLLRLACIIHVEEWGFYLIIQINKNPCSEHNFLSSDKIIHYRTTRPVDVQHNWEAFLVHWIINDPLSTGRPSLSLCLRSKSMSFGYATLMVIIVDMQWHGGGKRTCDALSCSFAAQKLN